MSSLKTQELKNVTSLILLKHTTLLVSECIIEIFVCLHLFSPISLVGSHSSCYLPFFRDIQQALPLCVSHFSPGTQAPCWPAASFCKKYSTSASVEGFWTPPRGMLKVTSLFNIVFSCGAFGGGSWSWTSCTVWTTVEGSISETSWWVEFCFLLGITIISYK